MDKRPCKTETVIRILLMLQVQARRLKQLHWDKIKTPQHGTVWAKDQPQVNLNLTELENLFQVSPHLSKLHMALDVGAPL